MRRHHQKEQSSATPPQGLVNGCCTTGLVIQTLSSDYKVARIGGVLIMIAIFGRLLLYVRGLGPGLSFLELTEHPLRTLLKTALEPRKRARDST